MGLGDTAHKGETDTPPFFRALARRSRAAVTAEKRGLFLRRNSFAEIMDGDRNFGRQLFERHRNQRFGRAVFYGVRNQILYRAPDIRSVPESHDRAGAIQDLEVRPVKIAQVINRRLDDEGEVRFGDRKRNTFSGFNPVRVEKVTNHSVSAVHIRNDTL